MAIDLFGALKDKGIAAIVERSAPQLLEVLNYIHADQANIAESLGNTATRLTAIESRLDILSRLIVQVLTELRRPPPAIEQREALHNGQLAD